ncbi:MAG: hypothetical protein JSR09_06240 [Bacteroidetes bacterium]|nr:hypothetical protein [Bacteroidota bacterium]MBS1649289.1 hypothetical protein [Bacteroidota bacterium]
MELTNIKIESIVLKGYSSFSKEKIAALLLSQKNCSNIPGDFVIIIDGILHNQSITIIGTSIVSAIPYFYTKHNNKFAHGVSIFEVCKAAQLQWQWDDFSLFCINSIEHTINEHTIHAHIKRIPENSFITYYNHTLTIEKKEAGIKHNNFKNDNEVLEDYITLCEGYFRNQKKLLLSLSAGFDSRLLLATALYFGEKPLLATMGNSNATDVIVAKSIANSLNLSHQTIELVAEDYFKEENIFKIINATSGSKTFNHWHTYFFSNYFKNTELLHLAGSNGELARTYYFDKGIIAKTADKIPINLFDIYFKFKINKSDNYIIPSLLNASHKKKFIAIASIQNTKHGFLNSLDNFYTFERVRHFISNGLALYNCNITTTSPFLDYRFINLCNHIHRHKKLNSIFHKTIINQLQPALMQFGNNNISTSINNFNSNWYFLKEQPTTTYNPVNTIIQSNAVKEIIIESNYLNEWLNQKERIKIWEEKKNRTIYFLLTMHYTSSYIKQLCI